MRHKLHGLRQGKVVIVKGRKFRADTMSDPDWVILYDHETARAVVRQSKWSQGRVFHQGMNSDYDGRESYISEYRRTNQTWWNTWDSQSAQGAILYDLDRIIDLM